MPDLTPGAELRTAAERMRYLLHPDGMPEQIRERWTQLPYPAKQGVVTVPGEERPVLAAFWGGVSEYVTAMQPTVGAALADWLDAVVAEMTSVDGTEYAYEEFPSWTAALATARAINTEEQP